MLAVNDRLPTDFGDLSVSALEKVIKRQLPTKRQEVINKANEILSCCDSNADTVKMIKAIAKQSEEDDSCLIDNVDNVIVWQKLENGYTCQEFLEEIGYYSTFK